MKKNTNIEKNSYSYYSRVLEKPFDTIEELAAAEAKHFEALKAKEDKAAQKKADAQKVENAFKALNAARKVYKEDLTQLTTEYAEALEELKNAFELGKKDIASKLSKSEQDYKVALKEFTERYPEGYHITLRDGDFETTISSQTSTNKATNKVSQVADYNKISDLFDLIFRF